MENVIKSLIPSGHVIPRNRGAELDYIDLLRLASFWQGSLHVCKLNVVDLCSNTLICFQNAVVDNTYCRPPNCHHNFFYATLALRSILGTRHDQAIDKIVYDYHKGPTFCHKG